MSSEFIVRKPAVAGMFYPASKEELEKLLSRIAQTENPKLNFKPIISDIIGGIVPHAGYIYSGFEAYHFFELLRQKQQYFETIVILNPDHQGYCSDFAASPHEYWETPLGKINVDVELASYFPQSEIVHRMEHSAEVMVPFIQKVLGNKYKILPISIGYPNHEKTLKLAQLLFRSVEESQRKIIIIASSDFSHYVEPTIGLRLDNIALEKIYTFDSLGLNEAVKKNRLSVCGFGPIMILLEYSKIITNKPTANILARGNSGKNSSSDTVVDYISIAITN